MKSLLVPKGSSIYLTYFGGVFFVPAVPTPKLEVLFGMGFKPLSCLKIEGRFFFTGLGLIISTL